jgi:hypothetical protein
MRLSPSGSGGQRVALQKKGVINRNISGVDSLEGKVILTYKLKGDIRMISLDVPRK